MINVLLKLMLNNLIDKNLIILFIDLYFVFVCSIRILHSTMACTTYIDLRPIV